MDNNNCYGMDIAGEYSSFIILNKDYKIERVNVAARQLLDKLYPDREEDYIGEDIANVIPDIVENNRISDSVYELTIDGRLYYMIPFRAYRSVDDDRLCILIIDIYSQKKIKSELAYQREMTRDLEEILEGSFDGILVTDAEGKVLFVNSSYERVAEIKKKELQDKYMRDLINPVWMPESVAHIVAKEKKVISKRQVTKSGRHIMVTGCPIFDKDDNIKKIIINARDITEIYDLTEELQLIKETQKVFLNKWVPPVKGSSGEQSEIFAASDGMKKVLSLAERVANFSATVLILGESGVGKEEVAKFIHKNSTRKNEPFIVVNCGAIPGNLLESELFGYEKGAFTGAMQSGKQGLMEAAGGGTIFLDEIGEMPLDFQVKLLRFLETKEVRRVGSTQSKTVDVRVLAATNRSLSDMVGEGSFREDLYYRLNVVQIEIPPLRQRVSDIIPLAALFLNRYNSKYDQQKNLTYELIKEMEKYKWPGNVRQLNNVMENMVIVSSSDYLQPEDLPWNADGRKDIVKQTISGLSDNDDIGLNEAVEELEKRMLERAKETLVSTRKIAQKLKINQSTVVRKLQKYNID